MLSPPAKPRPLRAARSRAQRPVAVRGRPVVGPRRAQRLRHSLSASRVDEPRLRAGDRPTEALLGTSTRALAETAARIWRIRAPALDHRTSTTTRMADRRSGAFKLRLQKVIHQVLDVGRTGCLSKCRALSVGANLRPPRLGEVTAKFLESSFEGAAAAAGSPISLVQASPGGGRRLLVHARRLSLREALMPRRPVRSARPAMLTPGGSRSSRTRGARSTAPRPESALRPNTSRRGSLRPARSERARPRARRDSDAVASSGADWIRMDVNWDVIERDGRRLRLGAVRLLARVGRAHDLQALVTILHAALG